MGGILILIKKGTSPLFLERGIQGTLMYRKTSFDHFGIRTVQTARPIYNLLNIFSKFGEKGTPPHKSTGHHPHFVENKRT